MTTNDSHLHVGPDQEPPLTRLARFAMGTRFEICIAEPLDVSAAQAAGEEALDEISSCDRLLSVHNAESDLSRVNASAACEPVQVDRRVLNFLQRAYEIAELTQGTCDLAIGALLTCWAIQRDHDSAHTTPTADAIATALNNCDVRKNVIIDPDACTVRFTSPAVRLDPGALGKGWALARATQRLREGGVTSALIHGGTSSVQTIGSPPGQPGWPIAISHPFDGSTSATVLLTNNCLSVSALHGRKLQTGTQRHGHVIDPRSGQPVERTLLAAVVANDGVLAEAWSTALLVDPLLNAPPRDTLVIQASNKNDDGRIRRSGCFR